VCANGLTTTQADFSSLFIAPEILNPLVQERLQAPAPQSLDVQEITDTCRNAGFPRLAELLPQAIERFNKAQTLRTGQHEAAERARDERLNSVLKEARNSLSTHQAAFSTRRLALPERTAELKSVWRTQAQHMIKESNQEVSTMLSTLMHTVKSAILELEKAVKNAPQISPEKAMKGTSGTPSQSYPRASSTAMKEASSTPSQPRNPHTTVPTLDQPGPAYTPEHPPTSSRRTSQPASRPQPKVEPMLPPAPAAASQPPRGIASTPSHELPRPAPAAQPARKRASRLDLPQEMLSPSSFDLQRQIDSSHRANDTSAVHPGAANAAPAKIQPTLPVDGPSSKPAKESKRISGTLLNLEPLEQNPQRLTLVFKVCFAP
jgi:hypothetical protein